MSVSQSAMPAVNVGQGSSASSNARYGVLAMLILAYTFNFLDRQILAILAVPIKADLGLSDKQLGLLMGLAFAVFYTGLGVPIAALADRWSRTWIMTAALALWSGFTAACGAAVGYWQLFACRMGVGIGEAGGVAPAYSLIADYFPKEQRGRALAAYSFGIPIGSAAGFLFGGLIATYVNWRYAFITVGIAGLLLAPLFRMVVKEPPRTAVKTTPSPTLGATLGVLLPKPTFWLLSLGAASASVCGYGVANWLPTFLIRSMHFKLPELSVFLAGVHLVGGIAGVWAGGALADKLGGRSKSNYPLIPAVAFVIAMPIFVGAMHADWLPLLFILLAVPQALNMAWLGPILTSVQGLVPPNMRATASAAFLFINNLVGIGFGSFYFGAASDYLKPTFGDESMRYAIYSGLAFYVVSAGLFVLASRKVERDWAPE